MSTSLTGALNSDYISAINSMNPTRRPKVCVYVEGLEDIVFWNTCLAPYLPHYDFDINIYRIKDGPAANSAADGKSNLIDKFDLSALGTNMLLAVDADYDWIIDEYHPSQTTPSYSSLIRDHQYILHTYLYAIENYKSHPLSLCSIISGGALCSPSFDIFQAVSDFSKALSKLFLLHIASMEAIDNVYTIKKFKEDLSNIHFDFNAKSLKDSSLTYIAARESELSQYATDNQEKINLLREELENRGFSEQDYYLLMQGHAVWNWIENEILVKEIQTQRRAKMSELDSSPHVQQANNHMSQFYKLTGINKENKRNDISERVEQASFNFSTISLVKLGHQHIAQDLERLFGTGVN